jgi:exonuclease VII small subunit
MDMSDNGSKTVPEAIVGQLVSRSAYDEALNAIMEGDKMLEAAIARAQKAEAREREIGEELDKATDRIEGLVAENTRFRHAAAETADLLMREAMGDKP